VSEPDITARADRVADAIRERELDCLLVTHLVNVRYLTGFTGSNGACVITPDERLFFTDFRYVDQAGEQVTGFEQLTLGRDMAGDLAKRLTGRAGFEEAHVSVRQHGKLAEKAPEAVELAPAGDVVEDLRRVKDAGELRRIANATELATAALDGMLEQGLAGRTERAVALELEQRMRESGAQDASFPSIVAGGPHGALPHAEPRDVEIAAGELVVIDWGARLDGYCSDCTRTVATGEVDVEAREVYELVRRAQAAALEAVRAGAQCRAVDAEARQMIDEAGHGDRFGHGLGHGVGMEVHEEPRLSQRAEESELLAAGNVVSVEPGVYLPGRLGVRIEDLVAVTDNGANVFTSFSKELLTVG
jgi:Xaa-Pro aminopeptidase